MSPGERDGDPEHTPDVSRVQERALERQRERADIAEEIYERVDGFLGDRKYPTTGEELAVAYADSMSDLPNETESLGDVFDRLVHERFESRAEAREAVLSELTGAAGGVSEYNDERPLSPLDERDGP